MNRNGEDRLLDVLDYIRRIARGGIGRTPDETGRLDTIEVAARGALDGLSMDEIIPKAQRHRNRRRQLLKANAKLRAKIREMGGKP